MRGVGVWRPQMIEVVAGYLAQQLWKSRLDLARLSLVELFQFPYKVGIPRRAGCFIHRSEAPALSADRKRVDRRHVVNHVAVGDGARAARVVACHSAERRLCAG